MAKKKINMEDAELEQAYENLTGKKSSGGKYAKKGAGTKNAVVLTVVCIVAIALIVGIVLGSIYMLGPSDSDPVTQNVSVAGVNLYGMTRGEAVAAVEAAIANTYGQKDMVVTIEDHTVTIPAAATGAVLDVEAAVNAAVEFDPAEPADSYVLDLTEFFTVDSNAIRSALNELSAYYNAAEGTPNKYEVTGTAPADLKNPAEGEGQVLILTIGTPSYGLDFDDLYNKVIAAFHMNQFQVNYELADSTKPTPVDLDAVYAQYCTDVKNAEMDKETFEITSEIYGYRFDLEAAKLQQDEAEPNAVLQFPFTVVVPEVDAETLSSKLFCDVLSEYTTSGSGATGRATNLRLACQAVNGLVLNPGEVFDYNATLGERTTAKGYSYGAAYVGGETIQTIGGGICQVSSTIYYCALMADMEIVSRINHGYVSGYLPLGMDATVSWGGPEFRFKNSSNYPIRIEASASGGKVNIKIVGTDDKDYYVKMTYDILASYGYDEIEEIIDPENNPKGYTDGEVISSPYTGYTIRTYRNRYDKNTDKLIESVVEATSYYNKRDRVIARIKTAEETQPSTEATTPSSPETTPSTTPSTPTTEATTPSTTPSTEGTEGSGGSGGSDPGNTGGESESTPTPEGGGSSGDEGGSGEESSAE